MIRIALAVALFALLATPPAASAQNAGEIARVRAGANCPRCNLFQADLANLELKGKNLAGARLRQADLSAAIMKHSSFAHGDLRDLNAYGALLSRADFRGADLVNASFVGAYLEGANFAGAKLSGVNFSGAEMARAVGLSPRALDGACGDASTTLPRGLSLPACR